MQFTTLLAPLSLLTLAAGSPTGGGPDALAIIYQNPDYFGYSKTIFDCECINLSPPLKNAIRSIQLFNGAHCAFFYGKDCGEVRGDYDINQPDLVNWATTDSIRCAQE
ncbi:hypothetical protein VHEMI07739 [[Torrubiella] hemipterigena]|uniref:Beta/gamma crystallin 'Greek key' domain-containing protein n=1 Tax=[Torrubiella] hemipterigena TaxID=1531966 RepID=A0A0A1T4D4_9HYPO|nr:hypothetical protein VHEMI07739 [[Torrubiella] hemipterigena]